MALVERGKSKIDVHLDYKVEFAISRKLPMKEFNFEHAGDYWQMKLTKSDVVTEWFDCLLHLHYNYKRKSRIIARIIWFDEKDFRGSTSFAVFHHDGDKYSFELQTPGYIKRIQLHVEVLKCEESITRSLLVWKPKLPAATSQLPVEMLSWFESDDFGDVTLVAADGQKFRCHQDVLARRSEVFKLTFSSGMKETSENVVNITDFDGQVVAAMLQFVYTDVCVGIKPIADGLYAAAHQYELDRLKIQCETTLAANLSAQTVVKTYRLASFYHLDQLLAVCVDYLDTHKAELSTADLLAESINFASVAKPFRLSKSAATQKSVESNEAQNELEFVN